MSFVNAVNTYSLPKASVSIKTFRTVLTMYSLGGYCDEPEILKCIPGPSAESLNISVSQLTHRGNRDKEKCLHHREGGNMSLGNSVIYIVS